MFVLITENCWWTFWSIFWQHYLTQYKTPASGFFRLFSRSWMISYCSLKKKTLMFYKWFWLFFSSFFKFFMFNFWLAFWENQWPHTEFNWPLAWVVRLQSDRKKAATVGQNGRHYASCKFFSFWVMKLWVTTNQISDHAAPTDELS